MNTFILSPSDFAFGFDQCKKCYFNKIVNKLVLRTGFPSVFSKFDRCQKHYYSDKSAKLISEDLDEGTIHTKGSDKLMVSKTLYDNKKRPFILRGKLDAYIHHYTNNFYSVIDFKTTDMKNEKAHMYSNQLHSYALMLENPSKNDVIAPVKRLGLFCFNPEKQTDHSDNSSNYKLETKWIEIERDDTKFYRYVTSILDLLHGKVKAESNPSCTTCNFINLAVKRKEYQIGR
jgi:hypothetical protein